MNENDNDYGNGVDRVGECEQPRKWTNILFVQAVLLSAEIYRVLLGPSFKMETFLAPWKLEIQFQRLKEIEGPRFCIFAVI